MVLELAHLKWALILRPFIDIYQALVWEFTPECQCLKCDFLQSNESGEFVQLATEKPTHTKVFQIINRLWLFIRLLLCVIRLITRKSSTWRLHAKLKTHVFEKGPKNDCFLCVDNCINYINV